MKEHRTKALRVTTTTSIGRILIQEYSTMADHVLPYHYKISGFILGGKDSRPQNRSLALSLSLFLHLRATPRYCSEGLVLLLDELKVLPYSAHKEQPDPDVDMLGGIQLLKLELELQNTWKHMDWGPGKQEKMECESHCPDDWGSEPVPVCHCYQDKYIGEKNNIIKSLLIPNPSDISVKENDFPNQTLNFLLPDNYIQCHHSQTRLRNPLEQLLYGNIQDNWANITEAVKLLILFRNDRLVSKQSNKYAYHERTSSLLRHPYLSSRDEEENTPLLYAGRKLLKEGAFEKAFALSELLIQAGSDVNASNIEGRTLLTYSVQYFDDSFELTRLLINSGASVWPLSPETGISCGESRRNENQNQSQFQSQSLTKPPTDVTNVFSLDRSKKEVLYYGPQIRGVSNYERNSAFTWFLRSIIRCRKLNSNSEKTLSVLCEIMGENPERMHSHVMRNMFKHGKCFKVLGPVFYQLKSLMMPYWRQPKDLKYLCRKEIRKVLGSDKLKSGIKHLGLPKKVANYILLE